MSPVQGHLVRGISLPLRQHFLQYSGLIVRFKCYTSDRARSVQIGLEITTGKYRRILSRGFVTDFLKFFKITVCPVFSRLF